MDRYTKTVRHVKMYSQTKSTWFLCTHPFTSFPLVKVKIYTDIFHVKDLVNDVFTL